MTSLRTPVSPFRPFVVLGVMQRTEIDQVWHRQVSSQDVL
jgi:hypothetical protein